MAEAARLALEEARPALKRLCWDPSFARSPKPARALFVYDMTFDPEGRLVARGISEDRAAFRPDTAQCLRAQPMSLSVGPPGKHVRVTVELVLP